MGHLMYTAPMKDANAQDLRVADAQPGHWAERCLPVSVRPYARLMRIERPIGWWLLLLPCWWGLLLGQIALGKYWSCMICWAYFPVEKHAL